MTKWLQNCFCKIGVHTLEAVKTCPHCKADMDREWLDNQW